MKNQTTWFAARAVVAIVLTSGLTVAVHAAESAPAFDPGVARRMSIEELARRRAAGEKPIIVDARGSLSDVIVRGAVHVPNERIEAWAKDVRKDALIVTYCS